MRSGLILILVGVFIFHPLTIPTEAQDSVRDDGTQQALTEARQVAIELAEKVRGLLLQEIEKGGMVGAVRICSELAQQITLEFNARTGHDVRRVSLKYRNPKNIPDAYELRKLEEFALLNRRKELADEYFEVVEEQNKKYLRYMKPLVVLPLCTTCHGPKENIPPEIKSILAERYPDDRATGFLVGDLRGAISVKVGLPHEEAR
jgi:hypothetical protein